MKNILYYELTVTSSNVDAVESACILVVWTSVAVSHSAWLLDFIIFDCQLISFCLLFSVLTVRTAIPIVMGANVGTSVTNTIVSLGNAKDRNEFRRAFAGATVHDMFNFLSLLVLLPLELASGCLLWLSGEIVSRCKSNSGSGGSNVDLLSAITKPFTEKIVILNSTLLQHIALDRNVTDSLIFSDCEHVSCDFLFHDTSLSDAAVGAIVLLMALIMLCACLVFIVKLLHSMLRGRLAFVIRKTVNSDLPKPFGCLTGYVAILIGAGVTMLVQSSSVFTSALTPLVGVGVVTVERMYPLTLGANIGTTITGILAALASTGNLCHALQIAVCHLIFNLSGILIWYPIPKLRQLPVFCSRLLGNTTAQYRWFPIFYVILVFFLMPAALFGLSLAGWYVLLAVGGPMALVATFIILINVLQSRLPQRLPGCLQNWDGLPLWMHSLDPLDHFLVWIGAKLMWLCCCRMCSGSAGKGTLSYDALTDNSDTDNPKGSSERKATYTTSL